MLELDFHPRDYGDYRFFMSKKFEASQIAYAIWNDPEVVAAKAFMEFAHAGQVRKFNGRPYSTHPQRVCMFGLLHETASVTMAKAFLTHDTIEDCPSVDHERLVKEIGKLSADIVVEVTNVEYMKVADRDTRIAELTAKKKELAALGRFPEAYRFRQQAADLKREPAYANRAEKKALDRARLATISPQAKVLKLFDRMDNIHEIEEGGDFARKYAEESLLLMDVVGDAEPVLADFIRRRCQDILSKNALDNGVAKG